MSRPRYSAFSASPGSSPPNRQPHRSPPATIGFCCAFVLILTLALPPQLAPAGDVHRLSAGMFAIGYSLSCLVPPLGGVLWDLTGTPAAAFLADAGSAAIIFAAALTLRAADLGRPR